MGAESVSTDPLDRVVHGRGKSLRDLVRQRRGDIPRPPDVVVRPAGEEQVTAVMAAALEADAVLIPFGGGSSISGSLEPAADERRPVISVDMGRMDRVLEVDRTSRLARVQAGVFGPELERQLNAQGYTAGHYPDSFTHSTLGGWIATRSSGMQSDRYGDIAGLTRGLRVVTPSGTLVVRPVPSTSTGPSVREMVLGSEGRLGIITEATVQVRRLPAERTILGYLFPTWGEGVAAMRDIAASEASPSVTRVSDAAETQFSFATSKAPSPLDRLKSAALKAYVTRRRGFDLDAMCLSFIGYEGDEAPRGPPEAADREDREAPRRPGDRVEPRASCTTRRSSTPPTSATSCWTAARRPTCPRPRRRGASCRHVYDAAGAAARGAFADLGVPGYLMCHLSHSYHAGACLYFTFAITPDRGRGRAGAVHGGQVRHPAGLRGLRRHPLAPPRRGHRARRVAGAGHLRARGWRCCGRCSRAPTPGATSTRARSSEANPPTGGCKPPRRHRVLMGCARPGRPRPALDPHAARRAGCATSWCAGCWAR